MKGDQLKSIYKPDLQLISAFFCSYLSPKYDERYRWAPEKVVNGTNLDGNALPEIIGLILTLIRAAPSESLERYVGASLVGDLVGFTIEQKNAEFAYAITQYEDLMRIIDDVVLPKGMAAQISSLGTSYEGSELPVIAIDTGLRILSLHQVCGFWCTTVVPNVGFIYEEVPEELNEYYYEDLHDEIIALLKTHEKPEDVLADLCDSAPDQQARKIVEKVAYGIVDRKNMSEDMIRKLLPYLARRDRKTFKYLANRN